MEGKRRIVVAANSAWNLVHFRAGLVRALADAGYEVVAAAPPDPASQAAIAALFSRCIRIPIDRSGLNPVADVRLLGRFVRLLRRERPAAFLGFTVKPNVYGCLAARLTGVPAIANVSGLGTAFLSQPMLQGIVERLYRLAFAKTAIVFFQNDDDRDLFVGRRLVRASQARLLPGSGIDTRHFAVTPVPDGPPVFLLIARLIGDKGVREFAEAARTVRATHPEARFQLLGPIDEGNRTAISRRELDSWVDEGVVEYLGEADDVRPFIEQATVIVLPSYREGLPRTLLEGAAMGTPLLATDVPGCRQVVNDRRNGLLCRVRDADALAAAMNEMIAMPGSRLREMGEAGRTLVETSFDEAEVVRLNLEALREIVPA
jgi:glycosyltransferase involved in cell wall biosynthesis